MRAYIIYIIAALSVLSLCGCGSRQKRDHKSVVTVTIAPYKYFVEALAGDKVEVEVLVPQGSNPETYEPTARQMMQLSESALYIRVGNLGFERSWMQRIRDNAPSLTIVNSSVGITPRQSDDGHSDPHVWMSVANARIIATNICNALVSAFPKDSTCFKERFAAFSAQLNSLDLTITNNVKKARSRSFLIYHPMLTYLAADYGLTQMSLEQEGSEPSAAGLKEIVKKAKQERVQVILVQQEFNNRNVEVVAKSLGIATRAINPLGYDWQQNMIHISESLR